MRKEQRLQPGFVERSFAALTQKRYASQPNHSIANAEQDGLGIRHVPLRRMKTQTRRRSESDFALRHICRCCERSTPAPLRKRDRRVADTSSSVPSHARVRRRRRCVGGTSGRRCRDRAHRHGRRARDGETRGGGARGSDCRCEARTYIGLRRVRARAVVPTPEDGASAVTCQFHSSSSVESCSTRSASLRGVRASR